MVGVGAVRVVRALCLCHREHPKHQELAQAPAALECPLHAFFAMRGISLPESDAAFSLDGLGI